MSANLRFPTCRRRGSRRFLRHICLVIPPTSAARIVAEGLQVSERHRPSQTDTSSQLIIAESMAVPRRVDIFAPNSDFKLRSRFGSGETCRYRLPLTQRGAILHHSLGAPRHLESSGAETAAIGVPRRRAIACVFGGTEQRTSSAEVTTYHEELRQSKSCTQINVVNVEIAGAGYP